MKNVHNEIYTERRYYAKLNYSFKFPEGGGGLGRAGGHCHALGLSLKAFTLAEVLITLGIIGVVAAMTLPSLVNKIRYKEFETGLNKNYTILQQALQRAQLDTGEVIRPSSYQYTDNGGRLAIKNLLLKYIVKAKDCGGGTESGSCFENGGITGNENAKKIYKTFNNKNTVNNYIMDDGQFITADGTLFLIENSYTADTSVTLPVYITVDVNGLNKNPNRWGYDLFTFQLTDSGKLLPMGAAGTTYNAEDYCSASSTSKNNGAGCTYPALTDKNYWKNLK